MALPSVPILIGSHHQCGATALLRLAQAVSKSVGLPLYLPGQRPADGAGLVFDDHSGFAFESLPAGALGVHMVRDPRDVAVSCWFHHLHGDQPWLKAPRADCDGLGLGAYLRRSSMREGMRAEMRFLLEHDLRDMLAWDYDRGGMVELSYEQLWEDRVAFVAGLFNALGFTGQHYELAVGASLQALGSDAELSADGGDRWSRIGMWRWVYDEAMRADYAEIIGDAHERLGYEPWDKQAAASA